MRILRKGVFISSALPSRVELAPPEESADGPLILTAEPGNTMSVYVSTDLPPSAKDQIQAQSKEILETQNEFADRYHIIRATVVVCCTIACADGREIPEEIFVFERKNQSWTYNAEFSKNDDAN